MSPNIHYRHEFQYRELLEGSYFPAMEVTLIGPVGQEDLIAIIDTGATYCLFDGQRAATLGIDLGDGRLEYLSGLAGQLPTRIHAVELEIFEHRFHCEVAFSEQPIRRELLGRRTLFSQVRFGFREGMTTGYFHPSR